MAAPNITTGKIVGSDGNYLLKDRLAALTAAPTTVSGSAGGTYTSATQTLIDDLVTAVNALIANDNEKKTALIDQGLTS